MLDANGQPIIGHGVIKPIDLKLVLAQLEKRAFDVAGYNQRILDELRSEQPAYYRTVRMLAESFANEMCQRDTPEWEFWMSRFMFIIALTYKIISVGIESRWMDEDIRL